MKKTYVFAVVLALALGALAPSSAVGASKEIIQLQTQVQALQDQMARMQQSFDERMGVMRSLVEQSTDNINRMGTAVDGLQKGLHQQNSEAGGRVDQVSGQIQALHDSLDELKARVAKVSKQLDDMNAARENLAQQQASMTSTFPGQSTAPGAQLQAPPADVLYNNALRDYNAGKYQLAMQEFADYLKFYGTTDLAGNAQFYIADIEFRQGDFQQAVVSYDKVLEQYPGGNKVPAAQLKKGFALLELGQRDAGTKELNSLITRYPRSIEASQARERLRKLGPTASKKPSPRR
jgi:tol-pal system protein YbgF